MTKINAEYHKELIRVNELLFNEESVLERLKLAVSAARHYLSAFPDDDERVFNLQGAIANMRAQENKVRNIRAKLEEMANDVFSNIEDV